MSADSPWLTDEQQRVWRDWLQATALLPVALHAQLQADSDLSFPDFEVLSELSEVEGRQMRVGDLARALQWERSRVSHHVKRMEARGLVRREECASDGRGAQVVVTAGGRRSIERAAPGHARTVRRLMFEPLSAREVALLGEVLSGLVSRLREEDERPR
ncbi:MarR family transcriptional regulator [Nocardioides silvaticus]|uniref:MarR family transcriptional regulator n=1 Tax=Nocardioides silvaticus TaxID=2201891 RepID=A0A316TGI6_9ACTN|nr:MarR family transcriptional regulator [Nocardioides silvaticus]PWN02309.1 MarR family transcriptional regulator [Nocardioides silvaticus]